VRKWSSVQISTWRRPLKDQWRNLILFYMQKPASLASCRRCGFINVECVRAVRSNQRRKAAEQLQQRVKLRRHDRSDEVRPQWHRADLNNRWSGRVGDDIDCGLVFLAEASAIVVVNHIEDRVYELSRRHWSYGGRFPSRFTARLDLIHSFDRPTRSSAVAERPRDASCHWIFR